MRLNIEINKKAECSASNVNLGFHKPKQYQGFSLWLVVLIAAVLTIGGITGYLLMRKPQQPPSSSATPLPTADIDKKDKALIFDYEPSSTTILQGIITNIADSTLTVKVSEQENNLAVRGKSFEVAVGEQTKLFLLKGNFYIVKKDDKSEIRPMAESESEWRQTLSTKDLAIGDYLLVLSSEDIRDKDSFVAEEVYKR